MSRDSADHDGLQRVVRQAVAKDALAIAQIYNSHVDGGNATFDTEHWSQERVQKLVGVASPDGWYVAEQNDQVIGWASTRRYSLRHGYRFTCETAIYLASVAMGRGVGTLLQRRLETHCRECGIHHAVARIIANNERSIAFHLRFGYEIVGVQKEVGKMAGDWVDVTILQKIF